MRDAITFHQSQSDSGKIPAPDGHRHRRWTRLWGAVSAAWRQWRAGSESVRALTALDDDDLCHLSETGQKLRQSARQQRPSLNFNRPLAKSGERQ